jgi:hypothetical protein
MNGPFGHLLANDFARRGFRVERHGYTSAGLARPDFRDVRAILDALTVDETPTTALLYFGGNDAQSIWLRPEERASGRDARPWISWNDIRWESIYESRAREVIEKLCARSVQHVLVVAPVDVRRKQLQARLPRIRRNLRHAAESSSCGHFVATSGDAGRFGPGVHLRTPDGVHMTRAGAVRVWSRMRNQVVALSSRERTAASARYSAPRSECSAL